MKSWNTTGANSIRKNAFEMYKEFQQILHEEQPYTFLYVAQTGFRGASPFSRRRGFSRRSSAHRLVGSGEQIKNLRTTIAAQ